MKKMHTNGFLSILIDKQEPGTPFSKLLDPPLMQQ
jgi:hypothetical protein